MEYAVRENRVRIVWLGEPFVRAVLNLMATPDPKGSIELPRLRGLPDGWQAESVAYWPERRAFGVVVSHPSFSEVPDGAMVPDLDGPFQDAVVVDLEEYRRADPCAVVPRLLESP